MKNRTTFTFFILILSGLYITNFSKNRTSGVQESNVPVLIPHYSPAFSENEYTPFLFKWHKINTQDTNEYRYECKACTSKTFQRSFLNVGPVTDTFVNPVPTFVDPDANPIYTVYWIVRIDDDTGSLDDTTSWSDTGSFIVMNSKLPVFIPHENPTHIRNPTFKWYPPRKKSSRCILKINSDSLNLCNDKNHLFTIPLRNPDDTSYTFVDDTLDTGTIYWKLEYDGSISSPVQSLTIIPRDKPIPGPFNVTNRIKPEFSWEKSSDAETFTFELDDDINFISPIISTPVYGTFFVTYKDLSESKNRYYWRVKSNNSRVWSTAYEFKIDNVPILHKFEGELYNNPRPTFQWDALQNSSQYTYRIQIAENHFFKPTYIDKDVGGKTQFTPSNDLPKERIFFWRVGYSQKGENKFIFKDYDSISINYKTKITQLSDSKNASFQFFLSRKSISFSSNNPKNRILGLSVYNLKGENVHSVNITGRYQKSIEWDYSSGDGRSVPSGMYLIKIISESKVFHKKIFCYN